MTETINPKFPRGVEVITGVIIENTKGQILLVKSPKWLDKWIIPGGHVEPGETVFQAAIREAKEETNLDCEAVGIFSCGENINSPDFHRPAHFISFAIYCKAKDDTVKLDGEELNKFLWISPDDAKDYDLRRGFGDTFGEFIEYKKSGKISQNYSKV